MTLLTLFLELLHVLYEGLLVNETCVATVPEDADVTEAEFDEALVDEIHWGAVFQGNGGLG